MFVKGVSYSIHSKHFSESEIYRGFAGTKGVVSELLIFAEKVRELWGKPININSGVRSAEKQAALKKSGYRAATVSPHVFRCALDFDTTSEAETRRLVEVCRLAAKATGVKVRIGWKEYLKNGQTFVHVDVGPYIAQKALAQKLITPGVARAWAIAGLEW